MSLADNSDTDALLHPPGTHVVERNPSTAREGQPGQKGGGEGEAGSRRFPALGYGYGSSLYEFHFIIYLVIFPIHNADRHAHPNAPHGLISSPEPQTQPPLSLLQTRDPSATPATSGPANPVRPSAPQYRQLWAAAWKGARVPDGREQMTRP